MKKICIFVVLTLIFFAPASANVNTKDTVSCADLPESFNGWRLMNYDKNEYNVVRHYRHLEIPDCWGHSVSVFVGCKELIAAKGIFTQRIGEQISGRRAALFLENGSWLEGAGIYIAFGTYVDTGEKSVILVLNPESASPVTREIVLEKPCGGGK